MPNRKTRKARAKKAQAAKQYELAKAELIDLQAKFPDSRLIFADPQPSDLKDSRLPF